MSSFPESISGVQIPHPLTPIADVPCGSCKLCCTGRSAVMVMSDHGDDVASYDTTTFPGMGDIPFLKFKPNGDCMYLGVEGCTIHDRAPFMCRIFDCREQHKMYTKSQRQELVRTGALSAEVLRRGAILLHQQTKTKTEGTK